MEFCIFYKYEKVFGFSTKKKILQQKNEPYTLLEIIVCTSVRNIQHFPALYWKLSPTKIICI